MSLKHTYRFIAPFYDLAVSRGIDQARRASLANVPATGSLDILLDGIGTGLDLPHLPPCHRYVGTDLVDAMLARAQARTARFPCPLARADSMSLPFAAESFDMVILHLIIAVVPLPAVALAEAARVTRPGGRLIVFDKFLPPRRLAPLRRLLNLLSARIATRLDVVFEDLIAQVPGLVVLADQPVLAGGWFRSIVIEKAAREQPNAL